MSLRISDIGRLIAVTFGIAFPVIAQTAVRVTVTPDVPGVLYLVDGQSFYAASSFNWTTGSKHMLEYPVRGCNETLPAESGLQYDLTCSTRYNFAGWIDSLGGAVRSTTYAYTASESVSGIRLSVNAEHRMRVGVTGPETENAPAVPVTPTTCLGNVPGIGGSGLACIGGTCYSQFHTFWASRGATLDLNAIPFSGFAVRGWSAGNTQSKASHLSFTVRGAADLVPLFTPAHRVQVLTEPPGLKVLVDRAEVLTLDPGRSSSLADCSVPGRFDFVPGSLHVMGALSPQLASDNERYVLDSWSFGGSQNAVFRAGDGNTSQTITAKFVRAVGVRFVVPPGLRLIVDGRDNWPDLQFVWAAGSKHVVTAPAEQFDSAGRKYVFRGWSNGGTATQDIVLDRAAPSGELTFTAAYDRLGMVVVQSNTSGVQIDVDGKPCATPCTVHVPGETSVRLSAPSTIPVRDGERLEFQGWADGASAERVLTPAAEPVVVSAKYDTAFRLTAQADPSAGADIRVQPASTDGWYRYNSRVQVFASAREGYEFRGWTGDTSGLFSPATVIVNGPRNVVAKLVEIPHISSAGVRNAADPTQAAVAPGSLISVFGGMLTSRTEKATAISPLPQRLAGTLVEVEGAYLPLMFVSPEQINAQLPNDLSEGDHTLTVLGPDLPKPIQATFTVVRNGPGLFSTGSPESPAAVAVSTRGSLVTASDPVTAGDVVTLLGTGLGSFRTAPPEGFGVAERPEYSLLDPVEVLFDGGSLTPLYAGAGAGIPGTVSISFRVPAGTASGSYEVSVRLAGKQSNVVKLPVRQSPAAQISVEE